MQRQHEPGTRPRYRPCGAYRRHRQRLLRRLQSAGGRASVPQTTLDATSPDALAGLTDTGSRRRRGRSRRRLVRVAGHVSRFCARTSMRACRAPHCDDLWRRYRGRRRERLRLCARVHVGFDSSPRRSARRRRCVRNASFVTAGSRIFELQADFQVAPECVVNADERPSPC
jgi:hypothetical protein